MDTIAFIIALGVGGVLIAWYAFNEARGEDGAAGALAITAAAEDEDGGDDQIEKRYRIRERVAPVRRAGLRRTDAEAAYRKANAAKPAPDRSDPEEIFEADKEY